MIVMTRKIQNRHLSANAATLRQSAATWLSSSSSSFFDRSDASWPNISSMAAMRLVITAQSMTGRPATVESRAWPPSPALLCAIVSTDAELFCQSPWAVQPAGAGDVAECPSSTFCSAVEIFPTNRRNSLTPDVRLREVRAGTVCSGRVMGSFRHRRSAQRTPEWSPTAWSDKRRGTMHRSQVGTGRSWGQQWCSLRTHTVQTIEMLVTAIDTVRYIPYTHRTIFINVIGINSLCSLWTLAPSCSKLTASQLLSYSLPQEIRNFKKLTRK